MTHFARSFIHSTLFPRFATKFRNTAGARSMIRLSLLVSTFTMASPGPLSAEESFINGAFSDNHEWKDQSGDLINAHDGGILYVAGTYYWYGMALRPWGGANPDNDGAATTTGIVLYSSKDLYHWAYETVILPTSSIPGNPLFGPMRFERPKIIYNEKTKKFVLWFHYVGFPGKHGDTPGMAEAGVATADSIKGPFTFKGFLRPIEETTAVKDCTLFQDTDGSAYFIYDRKVSKSSRCLHIVKLTDDYLHTTDTWARIDAGANREAPALLKRHGVYFLLTSGVTGWRPNQARYLRAENILGPYTDMGDPCESAGSEITYNAQSTYLFKVENKADAYIAMFERHNTEVFTRCSYIWLPVNFPTETTMQIKYAPTWNLDFFEKEKRSPESVPPLGD